MKAITPVEQFHLVPPGRTLVFRVVATTWTRRLIGLGPGFVSPRLSLRTAMFYLPLRSVFECFNAFQEFDALLHWLGWLNPRHFRIDEGLVGFQLIFC